MRGRRSFDLGGLENKRWIGSIKWLESTLIGWILLWSVGV